MEEAQQCREAARRTAEDRKRAEEAAREAERQAAIVRAQQQLDSKARNVEVRALPIQLSVMRQDNDIGKSPYHHDCMHVAIRAFSESHVCPSFQHCHSDHKLESLVSVLHDRMRRLCVRCDVFEESCFTGVGEVSCQGGCKAKAAAS